MTRRLVAMASMLLAACALFTNLDGFSGNVAPDASSDGPPGAPPAPSPPCKNMILNYGFEQKATCDPWTGGITTSVAHSGVRACQACSDGEYINILTWPNDRLASGDHLRVSLWVRVPDDNPLYADTIAIAAGSQIAGNLIGESKRIKLSTEYTEVVIDTIFPDAGSDQSPAIQLLVLPAPDGGCIIFDDVYACRNP